MVTNKVADISTDAAKGGGTEYLELGPSRWCKCMETWVDDQSSGPGFSRAPFYRETQG